ncbi:NUDIX hydrolase domain-like protein [Schizophyllum fasciatum]
MSDKGPKILSAKEMDVSEAKWITLKKLNWADADGKERVWECAERRTRKGSGIDGMSALSSRTIAVAIFALLRSKKNTFPLSTVIIEQYRPPIDKYIIELPAGLIDENETAEQAALRELEEETGYKGDHVTLSSPVIVADPGMTNANMKLCVVSVEVEDDTVPEPKLDPGEFIVKRVVELSKLMDELHEYDKQGFVVDARLYHFASGLVMAQRIKDGLL